MSSLGANGDELDSFMSEITRAAGQILQSNGNSIEWVNAPGGMSSFTVAELSYAVTNNMNIEHGLCHHCRIKK